jgi:hypothetical protein
MADTKLSCFTCKKNPLDEPLPYQDHLKVGRFPLNNVGGHFRVSTHLTQGVASVTSNIVWRNL